ncbi:hypothetical protein AADZ90_021275 [Aestuariibius sp. 2305UL40-4]|uniref:hypothetical protein n=1 Tax=Aestuariibius violaceus TaxID=3234132 RepID=UPI00345E2B84
MKGSSDEQLAAEIAECLSALEAAATRARNAGLEVKFEAIIRNVKRHGRAEPTEALKVVISRRIEVGNRSATVKGEPS